MGPRRLRVGGAALRLTLALPLACAVVVGSLWVGQSLRSYRAPAQSAAPTDEPLSQAAATPVPSAAMPVQFIDLPSGVASAKETGWVPSPDGAYLVGRSSSFADLVILRVIANADAPHLKSELVATLPATTFVAWMPDARSFIAEGTTIVNATPPPSGTKLQMKTYDVFRVDLSGTRRKIGEASSGGFALSSDAKLLATFDGDSRLVVIRTDGSGTQPIANDPTAGSAPALLGWDASGAIVRADYRTPFALRRIPPSGSPSAIPIGSASSVTNARWSPDHMASIVTATVGNGNAACECDHLLTDALKDLPADVFPAWIGPHALLTRGADERAGTFDALTGARTTLNATMRSEKLRVLDVSLPYVLWLDETKNVPHVLDLSRDRDTGVGLNPPPYAARAVSGGRFVFTRDENVPWLTILDMSAWFHLYVDANPTPSPIPAARDQSGVRAGFLRVENPDGGWSAEIPRGWYRRDFALLGSEFLSYDPDGMDFSGNLPPAGEARVVLKMANDYGAADIYDYARKQVIGLPGNQLKSERDMEVDGQPAYAVTVYTGGQPPPWAADTRFWFVRSPHFPDRVVVVQATNARTAEVDAIIASLRFFRPAPPAPPTMTRAEVIAKYSNPTFSATRVERVDAKLVKWKDFEKAMGNFRSGVNDPDELTWVVVVYGEIQPPNHGPCCRATPEPNATPVAYRYEVHAFNAVDPRGIGGMYSCCGPDDRPAWFDTLVDLSK